MAEPQVPQVSDEEIAGLLADPRWQDPAIRQKALNSMPPEMVMRIAQAEQAHAAPDQGPEADTGGWGTTAAKIGGAATMGIGTGLLTGGMGGPAAFILDMLSQGGGAAAGGMLAGDKSPGTDFLEGASGPLVGPAFKGAGKIINGIGARGGAALGFGLGWGVGHPYLGTTVGGLAGREGGPMMEGAGNILDKILRLGPSGRRIIEAIRGTGETVAPSFESSMGRVVPPPVDKAAEKAADVARKTYSGAGRTLGGATQKGAKPSPAEQFKHIFNTPSDEEAFSAAELARVARRKK